MGDPLATLSTGSRSRSCSRPSTSGTGSSVPTSARTRWQLARLSTGLPLVALSTCQAWTCLLSEQITPCQASVAVWPGQRDRRYSDVPPTCADSALSTPHTELCAGCACSYFDHHQVACQQHRAALSRRSRRLNRSRRCVAGPTPASTPRRPDFLSAPVTVIDPRSPPAACPRHAWSVQRRRKERACPCRIQRRGGQPQEPSPLRACSCHLRRKHDMKSHWK